MFKFLKDKLKKAIGKFSKDVEESAEVEKELVKETPDVSPDETEQVASLPEEPEPVLKSKEAPTPKIEAKISSETSEPVESKIHSVDSELIQEPEIEEDIPKKTSESKSHITEEMPLQLEVSEDAAAPIEQIAETVEEEVRNIDEPDIDVPDDKFNEISVEEPAEDEATVETTKKAGFFSRIKESVTKRKLSEEKFESLFWELEMALLENNVAVEVIDKIKEDLRVNLVESKISMGKTEKIIMESLKKSIEELFNVGTIDLVKKVKNKKPFVILFVGVNGAGKTTTIAKVSRLLMDQGLTPVVAAADTFRAAAIQQLEEHAKKLGVKLIKHDYGSDPAAVAYDTIQYAKAKNMDVVLVDSAGRQQSNANLMEEMKKIVRVAQPDMKLFIGESVTGNDCVEQARKFNEAVGVDGIILSKADVDDKGGAAISVGYVTGKPILYLGTGQGYGDLQLFNKDLIMDNLGF